MNDTTKAVIRQALIEYLDQRAPDVLSMDGTPNRSTAALSLHRYVQRRYGNHSDKFQATQYDRLVENVMAAKAELDRIVRVPGTIKVVYNGCFGGFGLSDEAQLRLAEIKGITLYPEKLYPTLPHNTDYVYYIDPPTQAERRELPINREDPDLVRVVEELGERANGRCARLYIAEIPDDVDWEVDEYDGNETIHEVHRTW